jgi:hypothetical protein
MIERVREPLIAGITTQVLLLRQVTGATPDGLRKV